MARPSRIGSTPVIELALVSSADTVYSISEVGAGAMLGVTASSDSIFEFTLTLLPVDFSLNLLASAETIQELTLAPEAKGIVLSTVVSSETIQARIQENWDGLGWGLGLYGIAIDVTPPLGAFWLSLVASADTIYQPTVSIEPMDITLSLVASSETVSTIEMPPSDATKLYLIASQDSVYSFDLLGGVTDQQLIRAESADSVFGPTIWSDNDITLSLVRSSEIIPGSSLISADWIESAEATDGWTEISEVAGEWREI